MNEKFLDIALKFKPKLNITKTVLKGHDIPLGEGSKDVYDFGNHFTGSIKISLKTEGRNPDAPLFFKLKFAELKDELLEDSKDYHGWISRSWIQEEYIHVDEFPSVVDIKRTFAFRYVEIEIIGISSLYKVLVDEIELTSTTSANPLAPRGNDKREKLIDKISLRTLSECMQEEFIDGPKRDRRLWLGDLRLEAITNYETFKNYGLVKRCLYLFAGTASEDGVIAQSVFTKPKVVPDEASMFDYSLLFIPTLLDYYEATFDKETLFDLLPLAKKQIDIARRRFYGDIINDSDQLGWCFLDWSLTLNKQAGAQAVYIYAENALVKILKYLGMDYKVYLEDANLKKKAALAVFYDKNKGLFTSGKDKQISYATNCWFILSGILSEEDSADLLERLEKCEEAIKPVTPYMYHHYVSALISAGLYDKAYSVMMDYWGGMADLGCDTFFELYNPKNKDESPYGGKVVNSYCHAWSTTPSYFLRKYYLKRR